MRERVDSVDDEAGIWRGQSAHLASPPAAYPNDQPRARIVRISGWERESYYPFE